MQQQQRPASTQADHVKGRAIGPNRQMLHFGLLFCFPRRGRISWLRALSGPPSSPRTRPDRGPNLPVMAPGEVAEWSNAPHSKCGIGASLSGVRIPPSPPARRENSYKYSFIDRIRLSENGRWYTGVVTVGLKMIQPWVNPRSEERRVGKEWR